MKKIFLLSILLYALSMSSLSAQRSRYYAIDGSEWLSEKDRDAREEILWDNLELHLNYIKKRKLPHAELAETYSQMMVLYKDLFASVREVNLFFKNAIDENGLELEIIKPLAKISTVQANNKETFYAEELRAIYNLSLDQFDLISKHAEDIVNYDLGETDNIPQVDMDRFVRNGKETEVLGKNFSKIASAMQEVVSEYDNKSKTLTSSKEKNNVARKKEIYYAFDGREYKTLRGRDSYEQRLKDKYSKIFAMIQADKLFKDPENIKDVKTLIFDNFDLLKKVRSFNETISFLEDDEIKKRIKSKFPRKNLTSYTARNKEVCYIQEIHDVYDPLLGIFEIYTSVMEYLADLSKENVKAKESGKDNAVISLSMDIEDQKDSKGSSHKELLEKANKAAEGLSSAYSELVSFYEREKRNLK